MQGEARIPAEIRALARVWHRAKGQFAFLETAPIPEIRGEPSARKVAIVLCLWASNSARTRCANSGSACSMSRHVVISP